jgi:hypothetical protein
LAGSLASRLSFLSVSIRIIGVDIAKKEMRRIGAFAIIAPMQDTLTYGNGADMLHIRDAVSADTCSALTLEFAIPVVFEA